MNYFELYPGDYLRDTTRLTLVEHGAYLRLLMAYYAEETPLPADESELFVIVSAVSASDKASVRKVAARFFPVGDDGLRRNGRADEEIAKAQKRIETSRANGAKNKPAKNPPAPPAGNPAGTQQDTQRQTRSGEALPHATCHQEQEASPHAPSSPDLPASDPTGTEASRACVLMRQAGCTRVNPSNPNLLAALDEGVTAQALRDTYLENPTATNPFAWAVATARSRHAEGATPTPTPQARAGPGHPQPSAPGKVMAGILRLEEMKNELAETRTDDRISNPHDARLGSSAGR